MGTKCEETVIPRRIRYCVRAANELFHCGVNRPTVLVLNSREYVVQVMIRDELKELIRISFSSRLNADEIRRCWIRGSDLLTCKVFSCSSSDALLGEQRLASCSNVYIVSRPPRGLLMCPLQFCDHLRRMAKAEVLISDHTYDVFGLIADSEVWLRWKKDELVLHSTVLDYFRSWFF